MNKENQFRIIIVIFLLFCLYFLLIFKLFYWQIIRSPELKEMGIRQSSASLTVPAKRGDIISSDNYPLATTQISYLVYANPKLIKKDAFSYAQNIADILKVDKDYVEEMLLKDLYWIKLADSVDENKKSAIESLKIPGIGFQENDLRYYPEASMAAIRKA